MWRERGVLLGRRLHDKSGVGRDSKVGDLLAREATTVAVPAIPRAADTKRAVRPARVEHEEAEAREPQRACKRAQKGAHHVRAHLQR